MNKKLFDISFEEFQKLSIIGHIRKWHTLEDKTKRLKWFPVNIAEEILTQYNKENYTGKYIIVCLHKNHEQAKTVEDYWNKYNQVSIEERQKMLQELPDNFYYWDKWLNKHGASTYLIGITEKLYTDNPKKYYITEDYFDINKEETEIIYRIKM